MTTLTRTVLLSAALLTLPNAIGGTVSASFQARLVIVDACRIDTGARAPQVRCLAATPSDVSARPTHAAFERSGDGPVWVVTF